MAMEDHSNFRHPPADYTSWALSSSLSLLFGLFLLYRLILRPVLRARAEQTITSILSEAGIAVGKDVVLKSDEVCLEWMKNGPLGIGETFMAGQWEPSISLDDFLYR
jgi:hypothetical protein